MHTADDRALGRHVEPKTPDATPQPKPETPLATPHMLPVAGLTTGREPDQGVVPRTSPTSLEVLRERAAPQLRATPGNQHTVRLGHDPAVRCRPAV